MVLIEHTTRSHQTAIQDPSIYVKASAKTHILLLFTTLYFIHMYYCYISNIRFLFG